MKEKKNIFLMRNDGESVYELKKRETQEATQHEQHSPSGSLNSLANALCVGDDAEPPR